MSSNFKNGEEFYHQLYTWFNGSIALTLLPMGWLLVRMQSGHLVPIESSTTTYLFTTTVVLSAVAIMISARTTFNRALKLLSVTVTEFRSKLQQYKKISINMYLKFLLAESIIVSAFFATGQKIYIVAYIIGLILLSLKRPSVTTFIEDLRLEKTEKTILLEKQDIP